MQSRLCEVDSLPSALAQKYRTALAQSGAACRPRASEDDWEPAEVSCSSGSEWQPPPTTAHRIDGSDCRRRAARAASAHCTAAAAAAAPGPGSPSLHAQLHTQLQERNVSRSSVERPDAPRGSPSPAMPVAKGPLLQTPFSSLPAPADAALQVGPRRSACGRGWQPGKGAGCRRGLLHREGEARACVPKAPAPSCSLEPPRRR